MSVPNSLRRSRGVEVFETSRVLFDPNKEGTEHPVIAAGIKLAQDHRIQNVVRSSQVPTPL